MVTLVPTDFVFQKNVWTILRIDFYSRALVWLESQPLPLKAREPWSCAMCKNYSIFSLFSVLHFSLNKPLLTMAD